MSDSPEVSAVPAVSIFNLNELQEFAVGKRVRKALVKGGQIDVEMVCYEPGQTTAMHSHPRQDEVFYVLEGRPNMSIGGMEYTFEPGSMVRCIPGTPHDARNLGTTRCTIVFFKLGAGLLDAVVPVPAKLRPTAKPA